MVSIRVVDHDHRTIGDFPDVTIAPRVTDSGALILRFADQSRVIYNPNWWAYAEERPAELPADGLPPVTEETLTRLADELFAAPGQPGGYQPLSSFVGFIPPNGEVHAAMQIHCICDQLRCPVILNPTTPAEREEVRQRGLNPTGEQPPQAEPLQRCSWEAGHEGSHEWGPGGWPYGPGEHHPECNRHPDRYNRPDVPVGEGQPQPVAGVTPTCQHPNHPMFPDDCLMQKAPTLALSDTQHLTPAGLPSRPVFNSVARESFGYCAAYFLPGEAPQSASAYCQREPGHEGPHALKTPGGDEQRW